MTLNTGTWDTTADNNVLSRGVSGSGGLGIQGTNLPSGFDNALRDIMAQIETWRTAMVEAGGFTDIFVSDGGVITFGEVVDPNAIVQLAHTPAGGLTLIRTDNGTSGPSLSFLHTSTSPAANDRIAAFSFQGKDSGGNTHEYGLIRSEIVSPTNGSEAGRLVLSATLLDARGDLLCTTGNRKAVQASTSGTAVAFTDIPAGVREITIALDGVSLSGTDNLLVQIGDSGGLETTGYVSTSAQVGNAAATIGVSSTSGFIVSSGGAAVAATGTITLINITGNTWVSSHSLRSNATACASGGGTMTISGTLDRFSIIATGANTFDAGQIGAIYS